MKRDTVHLETDLVHQHLGPVVVIVRSTTGNTIEVVITLIAQIGVELAELIAVILGCHVSTTAPSLVADAEVFHLPCFVATVLTTQARHRGIAVGGHIFNPLGHLLHGAGTDVTADVRLAVEHLAKVQELMRTKTVVLDGASPVVVTQRGALILRTDTVHPVIVVGKATTRPTHHGNLQSLQGLKHVLTVTLDIGDL